MHLPTSSTLLPSHFNSSSNHADPLFGISELSHMTEQYLYQTFQCPLTNISQLNLNSNHKNHSLRSPYLKDYISYLMTRTKLSINCLFLALYYLYQLKRRFPQAKGSSGHRLILSSLIVAQKFLNDDTYNNKSWAILTTGLFTLIEINQMEREFCSFLQWKLSPCEQDLERFIRDIINDYLLPANITSSLPLHLSNMLSQQGVLDETQVVKIISRKEEQEKEQEKEEEEECNYDIYTSILPPLFHQTLFTLKHEPRERIDRIDQIISNERMDQRMDQIISNERMDQRMDQIISNERMDQRMDQIISNERMDQRMDQIISNERMDQRMDQIISNERMDQRMDQIISNERMDQRMDQIISNERMDQRMDQIISNERMDQRMDQIISNERIDQVVSHSHYTHTNSPAITTSSAGTSPLSSSWSPATPSTSHIRSKTISNVSFDTPPRSSKSQAFHSSKSQAFQSLKSFQSSKSSQSLKSFQSSKSSQSLKSFQSSKSSQSLKSFQSSQAFQSTQPFQSSQPGFVCPPYRKYHDIDTKHSNLSFSKKSNIQHDRKSRHKKSQNSVREIFAHATAWLQD